MILSPIERLPCELLEMVFLQASCSVNLLQASPYIAMYLSSDKIYRAACGKHLTHSYNDRSIQSAAQSVILASKWMTWKVFKTWIFDAHEDAGCLCGEMRERRCFDPQWPPNFEDATKMVFSRAHLPQIAFMKCRLPKKLLRGPWTRDKVEFLRFLLWLTSMSVDWNNEGTRNIVTEGRMQAIKEGNIEAVELFNHNRRLGRAADIELIRYAVMNAGCNRRIVFDTARMAWRYNAPLLGWKMAELEFWCHVQMRAGNPNGEWVFQLLKDLRKKRKMGSDHTYWSKLDIHHRFDFDTERPALDDHLVNYELAWDKATKYTGWLSLTHPQSLKVDFYCVRLALYNDLFKDCAQPYRHRRRMVLTTVPIIDLVELWMWVPTSKQSRKSTGLSGLLRRYTFNMLGISEEPIRAAREKTHDH